MSSIVLRFFVAAITSSASVATSASASDPFAINITEPLHRYAGPDGCDSYDLVRPELLTFNVHVACMQQDEYSVVILNRTTNMLIPGCRKFCQQAQSSTCIVRCNVSNLPDTSMYFIKASAKDLTADKAWIVCINAKDEAQVSFVGNQPTDVWSADGSIQLRFEATGYPRPISYELSCDGRQTSFSPSGGFSLADLPSGTTQCTALAYTNRRLVWTEPLKILIHVDPGNTFTGSTLGTDSFRTSSSSGTATSTTKSTNTEASTSSSMSTAASTITIISKAASSSKNNSAFPMTTFLPTPLSVPQAVPQPHTGGETDNAVLLAGIVVPCTMVILAASVTFALYKRRVIKKSQCSSGGVTAPAVAASQLSSSPGLGGAHSTSAAPIINNSNTNVTIFNNTYKFEGQCIAHDSDTLGVDEPCFGHNDGREPGRGADDENAVSGNSLVLAQLLQSLGSLTPTPLSSPPTQLPNEPSRTDWGETSQKHFADRGAGYRNGNASASPHGSTAIRRLSQLSITSALTASVKGDSEEAVVNSAAAGAGSNHCDSVWARTTESVRQHLPLPLHSFLSETAAESDADERRKAAKYPIVGATRDLETSAFC